MDPANSEDARLALAGELYHAFVPELTAARARCKHACNRFNIAGHVTRRRQIELWRDIVQEETPLPSPLHDEDQDAAQLEDEPWVEAPVRVDYGTNLRLGRNVYINFNCTILDTCLVTVGSRTLLASNVSLYSATHPLDPVLRNGTKGPEFGKEIHIGEDCFIGGNVTICPGVRVGSGSTVGAGSVVTKDVPEMCVVAGNPARIIKWLDGSGVEGDVKEANGLPKQGAIAQDEVAVVNGGTSTAPLRSDRGQEKEQEHKMNGEHERTGITKDQATPSNKRPDSEGKAEIQGEGERLMTRQEWEDEMGRQIAEKALQYGASLK